MFKYRRLHRKGTPLDLRCPLRKWPCYTLLLILKAAALRCEGGRFPGGAR